ncbi:NAD-dependent deacylase [bacterium]|nr:NAD-dependent deacylase [candidate division CSSED10-310 bacterium]
MDLPNNTPDLHQFDHIVFFTGAGLSAESGIPTYRGKGGIWETYRYEEHACQRAFDKDPEKVWDFHEIRREFISHCIPSEGHKVIAEIEKVKPLTTVITQNIDGLHQRAGSNRVVELHGSLWRIRCDKEGIVYESHKIPLTNRRCSCGAYLRPDIVWFEDPLKEEEIFKAIDAINQSDLFISVGTSAVVFPAAQLPLYAIQKNVPTIEINIEKTLMTSMYQYQIQGTASEVLRKLW